MDRGGAEVMLMDFLRNIPSNVHFDFLINSRPSERNIKGSFDDEILSLGGSLNYIGTQWHIGIFNYIKDFKKIISKTGKPDVVHIHLNAKCGVIALAAKLCGIEKIISHSHAALSYKGRILKSFPHYMELQFQKLLIAMFATDYWGCSIEANSSLYYKWMLTSKRAYVFKNAIDINSYKNISANSVATLRNSFRLKSNEIVIGNVGRIVKHKKLDLIIEILNVLNKHGFPFKFVYAGKCDDKKFHQQLIKKISDYELNSKVIYLGEVSEIPELMSSFDMFLAPSLNEGFGMVAIEAQAGSVPCILSYGFPKMVDMDLGLVSFIKGENPTYWANKIMAYEKTIPEVTDVFKRIEDKGFDINTNIKSLLYKYKN